MKAVRILNLLVLGPQGSGKGTQADILAEKLKMRHISSGEALRETSKSNTALGRYLRKQLTTGSLTPIPKLMEVFEKYIERIPVTCGIIFDGFARQVTETRIFLKKLKKLGHELDLVLLIEIPVSETIKRLSKRGQCNKCGHIYILDKKVRIGTVCRLCGGKIILRDDDKPQAIKKRLALYNKRTRPVIRFFKKTGLLEKINGMQTIDAVHKDIVKVFKKRKLIE